MMRHPIRKILGLLLVIVVLIGGAVTWRIKDTTDKIAANTPKVQFQGASIGDQIASGKVVNILLLGADTGALDREYTGRTDTIMVLSLNKEKGVSNLVSLQRDTPVIINGNYQKLNAAYTFGGVESTVSEVEELLDITINGYALVNMGGLEKVVSAIGGVDVVPPLSFDYEGHSFTKGVKTHIEGDKALGFVRMRYDDPQGDYGRQVRQQMVIKAVAKKVLTNPMTLTNTKFFKAISDNVQSNVTFSDVMRLGLGYSKAITNMKTDRMVGYGQYIGDQSFQMMPEDEIERVHDLLSD